MDWQVSCILFSASYEVAWAACDWVVAAPGTKVNASERAGRASCSPQSDYLELHCTERKSRVRNCWALKGRLCWPAISTHSGLVCGSAVHFLTLTNPSVMEAGAHSCKYTAGLQSGGGTQALKKHILTTLQELQLIIHLSHLLEKQPFFFCCPMVTCDLRIPFLYIKMIYYVVWYPLAFFLSHFY